jgi:Glycosyl transferase family 11
MIVSTLIGGLGNQMFQYAAGRALALRKETQLRLDLGWLENPPALVTPRRYELDCFNLQAELCSIYPRTRRERLRELVGLSPRVWREEVFRFDPRVLDLPDNVRLIGYWVDERYFLDEAAQIRDDFRFRYPPEERSAELAEEIRASRTAVSVHVRRGDYVTDTRTATFHGVLPHDYYTASVRHIRSVVANPRFYVFSDDPDWCRSNLELDAPTVVVSHNQRGGWEDLRLMSLCTHHVIANSSFSWWGAWLNPRLDKIVIAPRRWIADDSYDTSHVVPPGWVTL